MRPGDYVTSLTGSKVILDLNHCGEEQRNSHTMDRKDL